MLNIKTPDGTPVTVNAVIKAKYPHVVHMQYQTANGYTVNTSFAWKKLLMIMLNPNNIEDNEEGERSTIFIYHGESKKQLLETATRLLPCLTEEQLAYIIGMEQAEEYKEKEGAKENDKSVL